MESHGEDASASDCRGVQGPRSAAEPDGRKSCPRTAAEEDKEHVRRFLTTQPRMKDLKKRSNPNPTAESSQHVSLEQADLDSSHFSIVSPLVSSHSTHHSTVDKGEERVLNDGLFFSTSTFPHVLFLNPMMFVACFGLAFDEVFFFFTFFSSISLPPPPLKYVHNSMADPFLRCPRNSTCFLQFYQDFRAERWTSTAWGFFLLPLPFSFPVVISNFLWPNKNAVHTVRF